MFSASYHYGREDGSAGRCYDARRMNNRDEYKRGYLSAIRCPSCPQCGGKMVLRERRKDGGLFWGCVDYPGCNGTLQK